MKHLFPAWDLKSRTQAHDENGACKTIAWGADAQLLGDKHCNLFCLLHAKDRCHSSRGLLGLTSILAAAVFHIVTRSNNWVWQSSGGLLHGQVGWGPKQSTAEAIKDNSVHTHTHTRRRDGGKPKYYFSAWNDFFEILKTSLLSRHMLLRLQSWSPI